MQSRRPSPDFRVQGFAFADFVSQKIEQLQTRRIPGCRGPDLFCGWRRRHRAVRDVRATPETEITCGESEVVHQVASPFGRYLQGRDFVTEQRPGNARALWFHGHEGRLEGGPER